MSEEAIYEGREANARLRYAYFNAQSKLQGRSGDVAPEPVVRPGWFARLRDWIARQLGS